jgi:hypothetical protein
MSEQRKSGETTQEQNSGLSAKESVPGLDLQYADLIETVWSCERTWNQNDRIDAAIRFGR